MSGIIQATNLQVTNVKKLDGSAPTLNDLSIDQSGSVVQVQQYHRPGALSSTSYLNALDSSTFVDTMSKTITTKIANSKILVKVLIVAYNGAESIRAKARFYRDSTIIDSDSYAFYGSSSTMSTYSLNVLDSPSANAGTTLTYKLQTGRTGSGTIIMGYGDSSGGAHASITLMEIVA
tara:strand:- start:1944 stop:2474 length:531 start_codon:yes stop_codon:yes gene_type:complete